MRWSDEYWQYRVATNIKEYHIISKLISLESLLQNSWSGKAIISFKNVGKKVKNYHV